MKEVEGSEHHFFSLSCCWETLRVVLRCRPPGEGHHSLPAPQDTHNKQTYEITWRHQEIFMSQLVYCYIRLFLGPSLLTLNTPNPNLNLLNLLSVVNPKTHTYKHTYIQDYLRLMTLMWWGLEGLTERLSATKRNENGQKWKKIGVFARWTCLQLSDCFEIRVKKGRYFVWCLFFVTWWTRSEGSICPVCHWLQKVPFLALIELPETRAITDHIGLPHSSDHIKVFEPRTESYFRLVGLKKRGRAMPPRRWQFCSEALCFVWMSVRLISTLPYLMSTVKGISLNLAH